MPDNARSLCERPGEMPRVQRRHRLSQDICKVRIDLAVRRAAADRVETEAEVEPFGIDGLGGYPLRQCCRGRVTLPTRFEAQIDSVDSDSVEKPRDGLAIRRFEPEAARARRIGEDKMKARRAVIEVIQRLGVGSGGIWMIGTLHHRPRCLLGPADGSAISTGIERSDGNAIHGTGVEAFLEIGTFENCVDTLAPCAFVGGGEFRGERQ